MTLFSSKALGLGLQSSLPNQIGLVTGLMAGLIGAYFNQTVTFTITFQNRNSFIQTLNQALAEMGFETQEQLDEMVIYTRSPLRQLFSGKVFVQMEASSANISSRSMYIKRLRKKL
ncbi:MAG: hypothetical protein F6K19_26830 [Cyanothece sp. SIO1E1]|nr:hypothetical protein [Cyanothece sp. SIO1E1]